MNALTIPIMAPVKDDFRAYLERSLRDPFIINLEGLSLREVIRACVKAKTRLHPNYGATIGGLVYNLEILEEQYHITLMPVQVTDIFWGYFINFCQGRGLKASTIETMCGQLRAILNWAVKYNATVSPTFGDFVVPRSRNQEIALTADEVSRITYFDIDRFYSNRRKDYRETMRRVRDMFVLSCNLFQRHSDMVRIEPSCFDRNIFRITQQKTGNIAVVDISKYAIDAKTTYRLLEEYNYEAPYKATIGNYNYYLHQLMKDIALTDAEMKAYREFEREQLMEVDDTEIEAVTAAALANKLLQFSGGAVYDTEHDWHEVGTSKVEALTELVEAAGEPVLVFYAYQHELARLTVALAEYGPVLFRGEPDILERWNRGEIRVLLCHPASVSFGLNMQQGGHIIVWYTPTWNLEQYQQANARLHRQGQQRPVILYHLVALGTLDERVMSALESKEGVQEALLHALKEMLSEYVKA